MIPAEPCGRTSVFDQASTLVSYPEYVTVAVSKIYNPRSRKPAHSKYCGLLIFSWANRRLCFLPPQALYIYNTYISYVTIIPPTITTDFSLVPMETKVDTVPDSATATIVGIVDAPQIDPFAQQKKGKKYILLAIFTLAQFLDAAVNSMVSPRSSIYLF
jgi:hypothetical protein